MNKLGCHCHWDLKASAVFRASYTNVFLESTVQFWMEYPLLDWHGIWTSRCIQNLTTRLCLHASWPPQSPFYSGIILRIWVPLLAELLRCGFFPNCILLLEEELMDASVVNFVLVLSMWYLIHHDYQASFRDVNICDQAPYNQVQNKVWGIYGNWKL